MFAAVGLCAPGSAAGRALRLMLTPKRGGGAGTGALGGPQWRSGGVAVSRALS